MRKILILFFVLAFVSISFAEAPVAEQPTYNQGDKFVFVKDNGKKYKLVFLRMEGDKFVYKKGKKEFILDSNLTSVRRKSQGRFAGPILEFPLKKGKTWSYEHMSGRIQGSDVTIGNTKRTTTYEVVAYEEITVLAGTFWAYKITATVEGGGGVGHERGEHNYWYAPDVKQIIKSSEYRVGTVELEKYRLK